MRGVYRFYWDCGRSGEIEGVFVADHSDVAQAVGKDAYFGDVLGKHSDVYGTIEEEDITLLSDDPEFVSQFEEIVGRAGYNPLDFIEDDGLGDAEE